MTDFNSLADAQRIVQEAWDDFVNRASFQSNIGPHTIHVSWVHRGGRMDVGIDEDYRFTGDLAALAHWWTTTFGPGYMFLPRHQKPSGLYQVNLIYQAPHDTWFNFHLTVP